jgi:hypothetical protein
MGHTNMYAQKMNLAETTTQKNLSSTSYCLANPGKEYLVYKPDSSRTITVNILSGNYDYEWFNPSTGRVSGKGSFAHTSGNRSFNIPFDGDVVLYIWKMKNPSTGKKK